MGTFNGLGGDCARINYLASFFLVRRFLCPLCVVLMGVCNALPVGLLVQLLVYSRYAWFTKGWRSGEQIIYSLRINLICRIPTIGDDSPRNAWSLFPISLLESLASHFSPLSLCGLFSLVWPVLNSQTMAMFHFAGMIIRGSDSEEFWKVGPPSRPRTPYHTTILVVVCSSWWANGGFWYEPYSIIFCQAWVRCVKVQKRPHTNMMELWFFSYECQPTHSQNICMRSFFIHHIAAKPLLVLF